MVLLYEIDGVLLFVGVDKFENDDLIKYSQRYMSETGTSVYWFHVDNFSSPHAYIRLNPGQNEIPKKYIDLCSQIVKNGSIEGVKRPAVDVIYTECTNLSKNKSMNVGTVSFTHDAKIFYNRAVKNNPMLIKLLDRSKIEKSIPEMEKELDDIIHNFKKIKVKKNKSSNSDDEFPDVPKPMKGNMILLDVPKASTKGEDSDDFM